LPPRTTRILGTICLIVGVRVRAGIRVGIGIGVRIRAGTAVETITPTTDTVRDKGTSNGLTVIKIPWFHVVS
jgi:hypothetical protein